MSRKKDSHKSRLEAAFGVSEALKEDLFDIEEREEFGSTFLSKKKPKDPQYDSLMREFKPRKAEKAIDFDDNGKYESKKVGKGEIFNETEDVNGNQGENDDLEPKNPKKTDKKSKKIAKNPKKVVKKTRIAKEKPKKEKIDYFLEEIEEEDLQKEVQQAEDSANSIEKAKTAKYQLNLWKILLSFLQMQPPLESLKKYPKPLQNPP